MANIVVCYKWVVDEADLRFGGDGAVDTSRAAYKISEYDRNALQAAVDVAEEEDAVIALTFGEEGAKKSMKEALSRGVDSGLIVADALASQADGPLTAEVLAAAIRGIDDVKFVMCSDGAGDTYARQTGPRLAALLGIPSISSVIGLAVEGDEVVARRKVEGGIQVVKATLPAVVSVLPEINVPPIPSMKAVLGAGKKPVEQKSVADLEVGVALEPKVETLHQGAYESKRKNVMISDGAADEMVAELIEFLKKEGVL